MFQQKEMLQLQLQMMHNELLDAKAMHKPLEEIRELERDILALEQAVQEQQ